jgi:hypothetical protein
MAEPRMKVSVNAELTEASLELLPASGMAGEIRMTLEQISTLIVRLGEARTALMSRHTIPPIEGSPVIPVFKTRWAVQPEALSEGSMIAFQHPAFGPIGLVLPPADIERVIRALSSHLGMLHPRDVKPS